MSAPTPRSCYCVITGLDGHSDCCNAQHEKRAQTTTIPTCSSCGHQVPDDGDPTPTFCPRCDGDEWTPQAEKSVESLNRAYDSLISDAASFRVALENLGIISRLASESKSLPESADALTREYMLGWSRGRAEAYADALRLLTQLKERKD